MPWIYRMTIMASIVTMPLFIYTGFRLAAAVSTVSTRFKNPKRTRLPMVYPALAFFYVFPLILLFSHLTGNSGELFVYAPDVGWKDYLFMYPFWWGLVSVLEITPFFVTLDLVRPARRLKIFGGGEKQRQWKWDSRLKIAIVLAVLVYTGVRIPLDTGHVHASTTKVTIKNLPKEFHDLRISFFGDIHMDRYTKEKKLAPLKTVLQSGEEDLIFFSGDLVSRGMDYLSRALNVVEHPRVRLEAIACMGDHDYWTAPFEIPRQLENAGWRFLRNEHRVIPYKGRRILVTGVTHVYSSRISEGYLRELLSRAPGADLKVLLVHQPMKMVVETAAEYGYHLLLGGHTHGGQIVSHVLGFPVSVGQGETWYCWGAHRVGEMWAVVTNGVGMTLSPIRYHAPGEIKRIVLVE